MRVVFLGSSSFSLPCMQALVDSTRHELTGVVAQPDRPSGRNRQVQRGVLHQAAVDAGVPVITPEKIGSPEAMATLTGWRPDAIAVASFGQYIPSRVLALPPLGVINVHPSLLPKYRGAAPLQWSIANGETVSGVTIFYVVKQMDAGNIILQEEHSILAHETAEELSERFSLAGASLMLRALDLMEEGRAPSIPQDDARATVAPKIAKADGLIRWSEPAVDIHHRIRGFQPWPGAYFEHHGQIIKVWRAEVVEGQGVPGQILDTRGAGPVVMTGKGALRLLDVQPEGKKIMTGSAFLCGHSWSVGGIVNDRSGQSGKGCV